MAEPKIIIHLGTYKTGSTAIQRLLKRNRNLLLKNKILYPLFNVLPEDCEGIPLELIDKYKRKLIIKHYKLSRFSAHKSKNNINFSLPFCMKQRLV